MTTYTATMLPSSKNYDVTEMQNVINDLFAKVNEIAGRPAAVPPLASASTTGVVKIGANVLLSADGTISVQSPVAFSANTVQATGIMIPMYVYPANIYTNSTYNNLISIAKTYKRVPCIAILNPSNGAGDPSVGPDGNYTVAIERLHGAGIKILGYVYSSYTARPIEQVEQDVRNWQQMYPQIDGIFVDEVTYQANPEYITYYQNLNAYVKAVGLRYNVLNPGAPFAGAYQVADCADIIVGWETGSYPTLVQAMEDWGGGASSYSVYKRGALVHSQPTLDTVAATQLAKYYGWVFVTSDTMPNPWDTMPSYLTNLFSLLNTL